MTFQEIEEIFNRALKFSCSRIKFLFLYPVLLICGVLVVFCKAVSVATSPWVAMSFAFMPVFLCTGILLAAGVLLVRVYYHEIKGMNYQFWKLTSQSIQLLIGVSYLALPLILIYLLLWTMMGIFHLLKGIPAIGEAIGVLLAFGPFILVLASLVLSFASLLILFFVTPHVALKKGVELRIVEEIVGRIRGNVFVNSLLLLIGLAPTLFFTSFLTLSAVMTGLHFLSATAPLSVSLEWFFIMVPFALFLTPSVIFFFNFATESYGLLQRKIKKSEEVSCELPS